MHVDASARAEQRGSLHGVPQLADVPGPRVVLQDGECPLGNAQRLGAFQIPAARGEEHLNQRLDVLRTLTQRWQRERDAVQAKVEV